MPVRIVGAAAGKMMVKARRKGPTSSVRATLSHYNEQMKITKIEDRLESLMV